MKHVDLGYRIPLSPLPNPAYRDVVSRPLYTDSECFELLGLMDDNAWRPAEVVSERSKIGRTDTKVRSASLQDVPPTAEHLVDRLVAELSDINDRTFRFDIVGIPSVDRPSVLRYRAHESGHFSPHIDAGSTMSTRKLTFVVQLSASEDYAGGDLVVLDGNHQASRDRGELIVFGSTLNHVVAPVFAGTRFVLVGWLHGETPR